MVNFYHVFLPTIYPLIVDKARYLLRWTRCFMEIPLISMTSWSYRMVIMDFPLSFSTPSNRPRSSRFWYITYPSPSQTNSLTLSLVLLKKMNTQPDKGFSCESCLTVPHNPSIPFRMSTGLVQAKYLWWEWKPNIQPIDEYIPVKRIPQFPDSPRDHIWSGSARQLANPWPRSPWRYTTPDPSWPSTSFASNRIVPD